MDLDLFLIPSLEDWRTTVATARLLEQSGFNAIWLPDSAPTHWRDPYVMMALCARETSRVRLGTGVTNPVTRHASVTAGAIANIEHLAPGRAILGIGVGDAAVRAAGLKPAKMKELAAYVSEVREWLGKRGVSVPVYQTGSGPLALATAGKIADGVLISVGTHATLINKARSRVHASARDAGRDPANVKITFVVHFSLAHNGETARRAARPMAARKALDLEWHAEFIGAELEHLRDDARILAKEYDFRNHFDPAAPHNRFVTDRLVDALVIAGTPEHCFERIHAMELAGVTGL